MRVAIFFDGKNFHAGWRSRADGVRVDFPSLSQWLVKVSGGDTLWGANYYTGVERGERSEEDGQRKLSAFLNMLELQPGFFVHRFPRKIGTWVCEHCGSESRYTQEKEVDTSMVVDMLRTAALGAADIFILVSGDTDHAPAVEGVRALGRQAFVASWGGFGLSARLRRAAFDHIDLLAGQPHFVANDIRGLSPEPTEIPPGSPFEVGDDEILSPVSVPTPASVEADVHDHVVLELKRAEEWFEGGYVGLNYFLTRWKSPLLDSSPEVRRKLLHQLAEKGRVQIYEVDGNLAVRSLKPGEADPL